MSNESNLPKWIEKSGPTGYETKDSETIVLLKQALVIAWEALEKLGEWPETFEAGSPGRIAEKAMRRIEELGKK